MTLPQAYALFEYWKGHPPEHELAAIAVSAFTTWKPETGPITPEQHMASLEARWKSGALSPKQLYEMQSGALLVTAPRGGPGKAPDMGGIGPFPGAS